jgi:RimJ/RimL family protein N-acetyltransferase
VSIRGQGLVTEGVGAIARFAFATLHARSVAVDCDDANVRSRTVCERLGFTLEGTLHNERGDPAGTLRQFGLTLREDLNGHELIARYDSAGMNGLHSGTGSHIAWAQVAARAR